VSPRRNRPSGPPGSRSRRNARRDAQHPALDLERTRRGVDAVETWGAGQWRVRQLTGAGAAKTYRCPGCDQEIRPGTPHVVVWPVDGDEAGSRDRHSQSERRHWHSQSERRHWHSQSERRHWHTGCWQARERRRP
jgi:hypothetical protein